MVSGVSRNELHLRDAGRLHVVSCIFNWHDFEELDYRWFYTMATFMWKLRRDFLLGARLTDWLNEYGVSTKKGGKN
ncbi:MAG: hypothetical protein M2R45_05365 [Verrucomicrobia subdivision 3 bacterium]|nr:hypothetical protein [Limisphaerales bacterium]MCS1417779.1 hypothetical protein [Limisphaerales bacterium]